jgi:hypothetical protein
LWPRVASDTAIAPAGAEITIERSSAVNSSEGLLVGCIAGIGRISNSFCGGKAFGVRQLAAAFPSSSRGVEFQPIVTRPKSGSKLPHSKGFARSI